MPSLATVSQLRPGLSRAFSTPAIPKTWGHPATGPTFNPDYQTEFRPSQIESGGRGWWALSDIPGGTRLRRVSVADGSLVKFSSLAELEEAGWDIDDAVNYGIGHWKSQTAIYFLNPGTAMNHADRTREASIKYVHDEDDVMELWTTRDVKAGDEMFNACIVATDRTRIEPGSNPGHRAALQLTRAHVPAAADHRDFAPCPWYDTLQRERGNVPLSQLNEEIEKLYK